MGYEDVYCQEYANALDAVYQDIIHNVMHNLVNNQGLYNNLSDPDIISIAKFKTHQLQVHAHLWH